MNKNTKPVIVVAGYNNKHSLLRLLNALENSYYEEDVKLIISIDYGGDLSIVEESEKFIWSHGKKIIRIFTKNQGCRNHLLQCIDYSIEYGAAIIFEDDMLPTPWFYDYTKKAIEKYEFDERIFAIALHNQMWNGYANDFFYPIRNGKDTYIAQIECSRGECFLGRQWREFRKWYAEKEDNLDVLDDVPQMIYEWKDSYSKYLLCYIVYKNLYYVTPYDSLTTCFAEEGTHIKTRANKYHFQVPVLWGKKEYNFAEYDEAVKYDAFFESIDLREKLEHEYKKKVCIDLYGTKNNYNNSDLILSTKILPYKIIKTYDDSMIQHELNCIYKLAGKGIYLYDKHQCKEDNAIAIEDNSIIFMNKFEVSQLKTLSDKHFNLMMLYDLWLKKIQQGKKIEDYLKGKKIKTIAIYGMSYVGERLYDELSQSSIIIKYGIDSKKKGYYKELNIMENVVKESNVDCIIVTAITYFEEIKERLENYNQKNIFSLLDILENL